MRQRTITAVVVVDDAAAGVDAVVLFFFNIFIFVRAALLR